MLNSKLDKFRSLVETRNHGLKTLRKHFRSGNREAVASFVAGDNGARHKERGGRRRRGGEAEQRQQRGQQQRRLHPQDRGQEAEAEEEGHKGGGDVEGHYKPREPVRFLLDRPARRRKNAVQEDSAIAADIRVVTETEHRAAGRF